MSDLITALLISFWLGILTSISPCPLASNIIAISYIVKHLDNIKRSFLAALLYTFGRSVAYIALAIVIIYSLTTITIISNFLQTYLNLIIGPILILIGMILTDLIAINNNKSILLTKYNRLMENSGLWGAVLIGIILALTFCPISAAIFFGSLIPLAIKNNSIFMIPLMYGLGTALPVIFIALAITLGTNYITSSFNKIAHIERIVRLITGIIFIFIGIYFSISYLIL